MAATPAKRRAACGRHGAQRPRGRPACGAKTECGLAFVGLNGMIAHARIRWGQSSRVLLLRTGDSGGENVDAPAV